MITGWELKSSRVQHLLTRFQNGVPPELTVPAQQWLLGNGFQYLSAVINEAMVTYGYGDYREVPIVGPMQSQAESRTVVADYPPALRPAVLYPRHHRKLIAPCQELQNWWARDGFIFDIITLTDGRLSGGLHPLR